MNLGVFGLRPDPTPALYARAEKPASPGCEEAAGAWGWVGAWRVERGDSRREPDPAGRAEGGCRVPAVSLHTLRVGANILRTAGSPSPPCSGPVGPHRLLPAERMPGESGGLPSPPVLPLPRPQQLGLTRGFRFCPLPPAWIPGLSNLASSRSNVPFNSQLHPLTHFLRPQAGSSRLLGARGSSGPAPAHPQPPESEGRSTLVGSRNSAPSVRGPAGAKRGGGGLASLCRSLPGLGTMAMGWGWVGDGDGGGGTENRARGQSQPSAREKLLFAPSVLLRSRERDNEQSKREETAEGQSRGEGNRVRGKGGEQRPRRRGTEGPRVAPWRVGEGIPGVPDESAGAERSWSARLARMGSSLSPVVPAAAGAPLGWAALRCAGTRRPAAGGESARLGSAGGEQNLRS